MTQGAPSRERFGDRIARLIGTITPESKPATPAVPEPQLATAAPEPAGHSANDAPRATAENREPADLRSDVRPERPAYPRARPRDDRYGDDHYHWHAGYADGPFEDTNRPLLDASILVSSVWRFRNWIAAAAVAGAVLGVLMALSTPHKYYAESRLFVDPREIRVTEDDIRNQQLSTEAMLAITDSQLQILSSTSVLEKVVEDLGLDRDPEFNGSISSGGLSGGLSLIKELFTGKNPATEGEQKALNNLRDALSVGRDAKTFVIIVGVDTRDPEKSALIANQIVETYLDSEGQAQSNLLERTSESIDTRINSLRADLDAAEREVERFKAENGLVGVGGQYIDDKEILALSDQLANARAMKVGIRVKAENLAKVKIGDVLSGAFPEELLSSNLSELRKQYAQTKSNADSLATRLGPRHPQYISAMQSLETITNEISAELRRIVASSQTELQRAVQTEQELASQMAVAKSRAIDQSVELVTLRELERKAAATRGIYEAFLTRSRETSERSNLSTRNVRVISPAEPPLQPMGPSRKFIALGGMIGGLLAGLGLALLAGAVESIRAYNGMQGPVRFPNLRSDDHPEPPSPGPRTPPGGPGGRFWQGNVAATDTRHVAGAPGPSAAGARARSGHAQPVAASSEETEPVADKPARREAFRFALLRPKSIRQQAPSAAAGVSPETTSAPAQDRVREPAMAGDPGPVAASSTGRNAQAFMAGHGRPQQPAPAAPYHQPDPRGAQTAYPGHAPHYSSHQSQYYQPMPEPQVQPYAQAPYQAPYQPPYQAPHQAYHQPPVQQPPVQQSMPSYPHHAGYPAQSHVSGQAAYQPGYAAPQPAQPYPYAQQPVMPAYQPQPHHQAWPMPQPVAQPSYPAAYQPPHHHAPAPAQAWPQPVEPPPAMPEAPARQAAEPAPRLREDAAAERIRRDMNELRSRIDDYSAGRRRA